MIDKFEEMGPFEGKYGKWRNAIASKSVEDVATSFQEKSCSAREISQTLRMHVNTFRKIFTKFYFPMRNSSMLWKCE